MSNKIKKANKTLIPKTENNKNIISQNDIVESSSKNCDDKLFTFVHDNGKLSIKDEKFQTKPTTFARDAFKRFCKNKSSVVGAIIIGVLLLGSFLAPLVSPYSTKGDESWQNLLEPKLFEPKTGNSNNFWNGTKMYKDAIFDPHQINPVTGELGLPVVAIREQGKVNPEAIVWQDSPRIAYRDDYSPYSFGGTCVNIASKTLKADDDPNLKPLYTRNINQPLSFDTNYNYTMNVKVDNEVTSDPFIRTEKYRLCASLTSSFKEFETLSDWVDVDTEFNIDLSSALIEKGFYSGKVYLSFEGKQKYIVNSSGSAIKNFMAIKEINVTTDKPDDVTTDVLCVDGNEMCNSDATKLVWISNASRTLKGASYYIINFLYNTYEHVFGKREIIVGKSIIDQYVEKGWCTFDPVTLKVEILSDKCPIVSVNSKAGTNQYNCVVTYYKYKGLNFMPKYILGSTPEGHDLVTKALGCLKTSLLVAIIATAICLIIGLIWGSISGYFGGTVDLIMERVTDIISGVPWTVMMTLIILLLGSNIYTFAIALVMTGWIGTAATTRTQFYRFRDREYVLASRTLGASDSRLIFKHILPNGLGTIVTSSVLMIPSCIFSEASISYLGLGLKGVDSFGVLFSEYQQYLGTQPMLIIFPSIIISLLMISFNLFGNGLRDALNPTLKGGEQ